MIYFDYIGIGLCMVYVLYIFFNALALAGSKKAKITEDKCRFTIVVPFRNEKENLPSLLNSFNELKYPRELFEVILVNDHSEDGSELTDLSGLTVDVKIVSSKAEGKKQAILTGITESKFEHIAQTDADCLLPSDWLNVFASLLTKNDLVCGGVQFYNSDFQNLELMVYQGLGKTSVDMKTPFLCNGANMAYSKDNFLSVGGYEGNEHISSGDDVYVLSKMHQYKKRISYSLDPKVLVRTKAEKGREFVKQRVRWMGKTGNYASMEVKIIGLISLLTNAFVVFKACQFCIQGQFEEISLIALISKVAIDFLFLFLVASRMKLYKPLIYFPIAAPWYSLYIVLITFLSVFYRPEWKNRKIQI